MIGKWFTKKNRRKFENKFYKEMIELIFIMIMWLASYPKSGNTWVRTISEEFTDENDPQYLSKLIISKKYFHEFIKNHVHKKNFGLMKKNQSKVLNFKTHHLN